jgi:TolA-binding protein
MLYPQSDLLDDILMLKSKIYIDKKDFTKASAMLKTIINDYNSSIWADDALFKLAVLEENQFHDLPNAQKHYQQLIDNFPGSLFVNDARKRFRNLRGDAL